MHETSGLPGLALDDLARHCAQQTDRYRRRLEHDLRYCLEIVRRAIRRQDEQAWEIFEDQSRSQVASWVRRHPGFDECGEGVDDLIRHAFEKLWRSFSADHGKLDRFTNYQGWMKYLQMCVHSVIVDALRSNRPSLEIPEDLSYQSEGGSTSPRDLWEYVARQLKDDQERLVMEAFLLYGSEPQDLFRQFPSRFSSVKEIYRIRQNVLARLRRDTSFRELFGPDD
jgi:hypothetical protein